MSVIKTGALILSGGKSRRMGQDKTTLLYEGESLLSRAAGFWKSVPGISKIYLGIGSPEHLEKIKEDGDAAAVIREGGLVPVTDIYTGCGPMAGIHAAFLAGDEDWLYVCAVDIPNMDASMLPVPEGNEPSADAYAYRYKGKAEPLFALYSRRTLGTIEEMLQGGCYKLYELLERVSTRYLELEEEQLAFFFNCNTPEDLKKLSFRKKL